MTIANTVKFPHFILLVILPLLHSCFELVEETHFNDNDSGNVKITLNASKSKSRLDNIMSKDSLFGRAIPSQNDIVNKLQTIKNKLNHTSGISDVAYKTDFNHYIFTLNYSFSSPQALNKAVEVVQQQYEKGQLSSQPIKIEKDNTSFARVLSEDYLKKLGKTLFKKGLYEMNDAKMTLMYHFDDTISSCSVNTSRISSNKSSLVIDHTLKDMLEKKEYQNISIKF